MRLKSIKLAGFKSFVDPTTVHLPTNLTAVVGPNGCGKSNIIDAVRWVMGESSAKQLRGQSLDDVIFNGSSTRKALGHASIELLFDNADGKLLGPYASYNEIAIRREIARDGQSNYYLNNSKCRRRDITDLFLGTGLGPRSYAIIEQGMISKLIEAKPEELRNYIEEVAGISKYKERRRETELRIQHTQENLARLNDIREELEKQLNHLQKQADAAERYKVLKEEERLLKAQIYVLRWRLLEEQLIGLRERVNEGEAQLAHVIAGQQQLELDLENQRTLQTNIHAECNVIQDQYYQVTTEVNRLEQTIQNQQERRKEWQNEYALLEKNQKNRQEQLLNVEQRLTELLNEVNSIAPQFEERKAITDESQQSLARAEQELQEWQAKWEAFNQQAAEISKLIGVEQTRIHHLEQQSRNYQERKNKLQAERNQQELAFGELPTEDFDKALNQCQSQQAMYEEQLAEKLQLIGAQKEQNQHLNEELDSAKNKLQTIRGQQTSLEALQEIALGQQEEKVMQWLQQQGIADLPRLAQILEVEAGWERAVETVLERYLQAVCIDSLNSFSANLIDLPQANLSLVAKDDLAKNTVVHHDTPTSFAELASKVKSPWPLTNLLTGIYIAENFAEAVNLLTALSATESIITRDGLWLGHGWVYAAHKSDAKTGVLARERELVSLRQSLVEITKQTENSREAITANQQYLQELEQQKETIRRQLTELTTQQANLRSQQQIHQAHEAQMKQRAQQINLELEQCNQQISEVQESIVLATQSCNQAQESLDLQTSERESLLTIKTEQQITLEEARQQAQSERNITHQLELNLQAAKLQLETAQQESRRLQKQMHEFKDREAFLLTALEEGTLPLNESTTKLQEVIAEKEKFMHQLEQTKQRANQIDQELRVFEQQRHHLEQDILAKRNELEQARLAGQAHEVRAKTLEEQIEEGGHQLSQLLTELPADSSEALWEETLTKVLRKIERLGPINLAAIDEYTTQAERKEYLDTQYNDLIEALTILQDAMHKMDRETKVRFKEAFDKINENFQNLFPVLFGGGRAVLQLSEDDLLTTGITLMAHPPGKKNSTIHLLSGGEKALTAIALVFALFQLNPAPFCMLDEVDAPLDDANVSRFCNLVKQLSSDVQFIFISHNKLAIEMAQQLSGVTMHEAGVSRLVAVDIEEAIAMATA